MDILECVVCLIAIKVRSGRATESALKAPLSKYDPAAVVTAALLRFIMVGFVFTT